MKEDRPGLFDLVPCVSATSAPSGRVFPVAGITISKHASDLIFLHDSLETTENFELKAKGLKLIPLLIDFCEIS